ncbi:probable disease resistance protein At4g27220 [Daucus carota subsp. sativus]|uniref:probable disease resistance protein At4g27220 n=1 Tax=Daucus carota subsp. sativus TaxID=79200 RepID=UPI0007B2A350|nr:PREDICTED: probable disease resistance protein At4g27220 [Daucus carota subsp. sativus]
MVGLADIPIVGKLVDRISDAAVDTIFRGFRYMFFYKHLVKTLDSQVEKANTEEERVSRKVAAERANGKLIEPHVDKWQKEAEEIKESAEKFAEEYKNRQSWRCIQCVPIPNPVSRFRLGREAVKKTERLTELIDSGKELLANEIAHLASPENLPKSNTEFQEFQSRNESYGELWRKLTTDSTPIIGIYGMPGVGKTRMMEQLWKEAKEKMIFNKVTRGNVGNGNLDVIQLQKQIAGHLECHFESEDNAESRASQLKQSLLNVGKTLVILDDVWREIPLDVIGIPCSMGSKILLTSREENVCFRNNCKTLVKLTPLPNDEAWGQFKNIVGTAQIDSMHDESLAKKVCDKCGGLPLLIHAISKALQFQTHNSWVDAFEQLEKGEFVNIPGVEPQVYACVELSINKLHGDAKSCLFLCCLFPEDYNIPIERLIQLATGSQLVSGESRVLSMVDTLRSSSLLLDCEEDDSIKLHDVIRDVGRSIAFIDRKFAFLQVTCDVRLVHDADFVITKFLRLDLGGDNIHIPDDLVCPDLHSLWIQFNNVSRGFSRTQQFSGGFFSLSANLRFLFLVDTFPPSKLQFSLQPLGKLRTLIFDNCDLTQINNTNGGFFPEYLETLCISDGPFPEPLDLSNLKYLRKLEIKGSGRRLIMKPNTISSLSGLEQLHIPGGFEIWRDDSSVVAKPILVEINALTHLKSLQMKFQTSEPFQDTKIFDNLKLFNILVVRGLSYYDKADLSYKTSIELEGYHKESLKSLVERAEYVQLKHSDINGIGSILDNNRELRKLHLEECNEMEHLASMSQGEIQLSQQTSFSKLTCLEIKRCRGLKYLFCNSVAKCLTQLQKLMIKDCHVIEVIIINEGSTNGDIIHFSKLEELELSNVPRLRTFYGANKDTVMQPSAQFPPLFHRMVEFPSLEILKIFYVEDASDIWESDYNNDSRSFCKLKSFSLDYCSRFETVIPIAMLHKLQNLQSLSISDCSSVISEVGLDGKNIDVCPLLALSVMYLKGLPCLEETGLNLRNSSTATNLYPNLKTLEIFRCHNLRNVFRHSSVFRSVVHLEEIKLEECKMMREIIGEGEQEEITHHVLVFPKLKDLRSKHLSTLSRIWYNKGEEVKVEFPSLMDFVLARCGKVNLESIEFSSQLKSLNISCDDEIQLPSEWQPRLHNLETLILSRVWWHELKSLQFPRLKVLEVRSYCGGSALFTFSGFRSLQQLQELEISDCAFLQEIVEDFEMSGMNSKTITLSHLEIVVLKNLPKLKSIIHGANYGCRIPSLREVFVENCGLSSLFSFSEFTRLRRLDISSCALLEEIVEDIRSDEVSGMNKKTITLSQLESVTLKDLPKLKSFIYSANHECLLLPDLRSLSVSNCGLSSLFMCSGSLQSLRDLKVRDCRMLEGIFEYARGDETSGTSEQSFISLSELETLELKNLPDLKSFIHGANYDCYMPALKFMRVHDCGFSTLFTCSVFRNLLKLRELEVSHCILLEDIVEDARGDDTNDKTITLPELAVIQLVNLPNLKSFGPNESYAFNMPRLYYFDLVGCPRAQNFTCLNANTGKEYVTYVE